MRSRFWAITVLVFISITAVLGAEPAPKERSVKAKHRPFHGTIKAVSKPLRAIVLRGKKAQTFFVIRETKIRRNGHPITFEQITVGEKLGGYARQTPEGRWEALTLNLGEKKQDTNQPLSKRTPTAPSPNTRR